MNRDPWGATHRQASRSVSSDDSDSDYRRNTRSPARRSSSPRRRPSRSRTHSRSRSRSRSFHSSVSRSRSPPRRTGPARRRTSGNMARSRSNSPYNHRNTNRDRDRYKDRQNTSHGGGHHGSYGSNSYHNDHRNRTSSRHDDRDHRGRDKEVLKPFKEFLRDLPDDVTPKDAQEQYDKYKERLNKSEEEIFFREHKDEEWFQERYDPIVVGKIREERKDFARKAAPEFRRLFENDLLPEINQNIHDIQEPRSGILPEDVPMPEADKVEDAKPEEGSIEPAAAASEAKENANGKEEADPEPKQEPKVEVEEKTTDTPTEEATTPISQTKASEFRGPQSSPVSEFRKIEDRFHENSVFVQGVPLTVKRKELLDLFSKRDGFKKLTLSDPIRNSRRVRYAWVEFETQEQCEHVLQETVFGGLNGALIESSNHFLSLLPKQKSRRRPKTCPPASLANERIRQDLNHAKRIIFKLDSYSDVDHGVAAPMKTSDPVEAEKDGDKEPGKLKDESTDAAEALPSDGDPTQPDGTTDGASSPLPERSEEISEPHDMDVDLEDESSAVTNASPRESRDLVKGFDTTHFLAHHRKFKAFCPVQQLNTCIAYLRRVHFFCYYCVRHFLGEEQMYAKCSNIHERVVHNAGQSEKTSKWGMELDDNVKRFLKRTYESESWEQRKRRKLYENNTKRVSDGKYRCIACKKLFRAPKFVHKHINNKHGDLIEKYISDSRERQTRQNYLKNYEKLPTNHFEDRPGFGGRPPSRPMGSSRPYTSHGPSSFSQYGGNYRRGGGGPFQMGGNFRGPSRGSFAGGGRGGPYPDPLDSYGRSMPPPMGFPDAMMGPSRTMRSYRGVEIPPDDFDEEIDYGFGDAIKAPKFNL